MSEEQKQEQEAQKSRRRIWNRLSKWLKNPRRFDNQDAIGRQIMRELEMTYRNGYSAGYRQCQTDISR